jgi:hypothetical protein
MGFMDKLKGLFGSAKEKAADVADKAGDVAGDVAEKAGDMAETAWDKTKDVAGDVADKAGDVAEAATATTATTATTAATAAARQPSSSLPTGLNRRSQQPTSSIREDAAVGSWRWDGRQGPRRQ